MTLEAIMEAIRNLSDDDRRKLAGWINEVNESAWDAEIERDFAPGGRGVAWLESLEREIAEGKTRPIEEGFATKRKPKK